MAIKLDDLDGMSSSQFFLYFFEYLFNGNQAHAVSECAVFLFACRTNFRSWHEYRVRPVVGTPAVWQTGFYGAIQSHHLAAEGDGKVQRPGAVGDNHGRFFQNTSQFFDVELPIQPHNIGMCMRNNAIHKLFLSSGAGDNDREVPFIENSFRQLTKACRGPIQSRAAAAGMKDDV